MNEKRKLDYDAFLARGVYDSFDIQYCLDRLMEADRAFQESDALLQATEDITGIDYASQSNRFYRILDAYGKLRRFMNRYVEEVWDVDKEFYSAVENGPAEALSHVRLEDIRIPNTLGLSSHDARAGTDIPLSHLSIKEFIREPEALNNNYVRGFAELFQEEVEPAGEPMTLKEFLEELEKASTYSNDIHKPWLEILSGLLNMASFGVKPLYECICGYDIITGEQLSTGERVWTGVEAVLDFLPVFGVAKAAEKGLVKTLGAETVNGIENRLRGDVAWSAVEGGNSINLTITTRNSSRGNPNTIMHFDVELNTRQIQLLQQLPDCDSIILVNKNDVNLRDLAALTAKTGDEFAMFTRGSQRMIIRGNSNAVNINKTMAQELYNAGFKWSGHTHPGSGINITLSSPGDRYILEQFYQTQSVILDSQGNFNVFEIEE